MTITKPTIRHIANLWSLVGYPPNKKAWDFEKQLAAVKEAGFYGITTWGNADMKPLLQKNKLAIIGYFSSSEPADFEKHLQSNKDAGATLVNVQLGDHDTPTKDAVKMAVALIKASRKLEMRTSVEIHRDTCTETPEKTYALADGFQKATKELLPMTWDFSHLAVVKHIAPPFANRLLVRPDLIQLAEQFHCRPFNGHHCQVPVTDGKGKLTPEVQDYLQFIEDLFVMWLSGPSTSREIFVVPEMGPVPGGYNLSTLPNSWEDAVHLRPLLEDAWLRAKKKVKKK